MELENEKLSVTLSMRSKIMIYKNKIKLLFLNKSILNWIHTGWISFLNISPGLIAPCILILYLILSRFGRASERIAFTRVDHARELHRTNRVASMRIMS